ncbi:hypothetical protein Tco_0504545 [Tanacetum coccineum]
MANLEFCDTHNMVTYLKKTEGSEGFHQIVDFLKTSHIRYALTENPTIYVSLIQQFWQTATASTLDNGEMKIIATIYGKIKIVTEASIRRYLKLEDSDGISNLPTTEIFEQLALMGLYIASTLPQKLFSNMKRVSKGYTGVDIPLFQTMLVQGLVVQGEGSTHPVESHQTPIGALSTSQLHLSPTIRSSMRQETEVPQPSSPTHTHVADEAVSFSEDDKMVRADTTVSSLEAGHDSGLFSPLNLDLSNSDLKEFQQLEFEGYGPKTSKNVSEDTSNEVRESLDAPMVEKLVSDDKLENKTIFPTAKIEFVRPKQQEKSVRKQVKYAEMYRSQACFVCGSFDHVQANCNYHQRERVVSGNNYTRVNYNYSTKKAHPSAHRNMAPRAVLMKTSLRLLNTARPVNTAHPKTTVYSARPMSCFSKSAQSTVKRPYQIKTTLTNKNFSQKVNTAKGSFYTARPKAVNTARPNSAVVNAVRINQVNAVKTSACHPQKEDQCYVDSGCSRHMTGNMSYLSDFKEFDGGYVTFGGGVKAGKLLVKELLKLMCDKKNSVLFTDTACFVLSHDFKLADKKNIVPKESLTCLVAKATLDESML